MNMDETVMGQSEMLGLPGSQCKLQWNWKQPVDQILLFPMGQVWEVGWDALLWGIWCHNGIKWPIMSSVVLCNLWQPANPIQKDSRCSRTGGEEMSVRIADMKKKQWLCWKTLRKWLYITDLLSHWQMQSLTDVARTLQIIVVLKPIWTEAGGLLVGGKPQVRQSHIIPVQGC